MGRSHVRSSKGDAGSDVAVLGELGEDSWKSASCSPDVFPDEERRLSFVGDSDLLEEESRALAIKPGLLSGDAEVLARSAASDDVHEATPRAAVEGEQIVPDRSVTQLRARHPCHESGRCKGFPLDVHHSAGSKGALKGEVETSSTAADGQNAEGTWSHIHRPRRERTNVSR